MAAAVSTIVWQGVERGTGRSISLFQRPAAASRWAARWIYQVQGGDEPRQVKCERAALGDAVDGRVLPMQPRVDLAGDENISWP